MKVNILVVISVLSLAYSMNAACYDANCIYCPDTYTCKGCKSGYGVRNGRCDKCYDAKCSQCDGDTSMN